MCIRPFSLARSSVNSREESVNETEQMEGRNELGLETVCRFSGKYSFTEGIVYWDVVLNWIT